MNNTAALKLTLINGDTVTTTEHANMPAAKRYLERYAASRNWFYSRRQVDARNWVGAFNLRNKAEKLATYTIEKV